MLFRDFLQKNAEALFEDGVVFDWSWPDARYELKISSDLKEVTHRLIRKDKIGPWTQVKISNLRKFEVVSVSVPPRKLVSNRPIVRIITDDGYWNRG